MTWLTNPHRFGGGLAAAEYPSTSSAEASGDTWAEGAIITITGGPVLKYLSAYDNRDNGGCYGLVHRNPFNDADVLANGAPHAAGLTPGGADPDSWGWTDGSTGTPGVDYDFTAGGGLSHFKDLTAGGHARKRIVDGGIDTDDLRTLMVVDAAELISSSGSNWHTAIFLGVYVPTGTPSSFARLSLSVGQTTWHAMDDYFVTFTDLLKAGGTPQRIYIYADGENEQQAIWFDDDSAPAAVIASLPKNGSSPWGIKGQIDAGAASISTADFAMAYVAMGNWSKAA